MCVTTTTLINLNSNLSMKLNQLKASLPELNGELLDLIFERVYDFAEMPENNDYVKPDKVSSLLGILKALQKFNFYHRPDETGDLFGPMSKHFNFERNSEGTTDWLSLLLAIKELYGLTDKNFAPLIRASNVRK